jgi:hypothetical protein
VRQATTATFARHLGFELGGRDHGNPGPAVGVRIALVVLLVALAALLVPPVRRAVAGWLGPRGARIERRSEQPVPVPASTSSTSPAEPVGTTAQAETIAGVRGDHVATDDGQYLYTLYRNEGGGVFVHALDLSHGAQHCIDLPVALGLDHLAATIAASGDGSRLYALSANGRLAAIATHTHDAPTDTAPSDPTVVALADLHTEADGAAPISQWPDISSRRCSVVGSWSSTRRAVRSRPSRSMPRRRGWRRPRRGAHRRARRG